MWCEWWTCCWKVWHCGGAHGAGGGAIITTGGGAGAHGGAHGATGAAGIATGGAQALTHFLDPELLLADPFLAFAAFGAFPASTNKHNAKATRTINTILEAILASQKLFQIGPLFK